MPNMHTRSSVTIKGNASRSCGCTHEHHRQSDRFGRDARLWHWSVVYPSEDDREESECSQHVRQLRRSSFKQLACTWLCLPRALLPLRLSVSNSKMGRQTDRRTMLKLAAYATSCFTCTLLGTPSGAVPGGGVAAVHCDRTVRTADW
jgi:hypothetical protein